MRLEIEAVQKSFRGTTALENVTLSLPEELVALLGPNGAGKTTLLKILSMQIRPDSGKIVYGDMDWSQERSVKEAIGYVPQRFSFYPYLTVWECLIYVGLMKGMNKKTAAGCAEELLEKVNLTEYKNRRINALSGGMLRRVGIAQALIGSPQILLIDEPTAGLDVEEQFRFRRLVAEHVKARLSVISTHITDDIELICSYVVLLSRGKVVFQGKKDDFVEKARGWIREESVSMSDYAELERSVHVLRVARRGDTQALVRYILPQKSSQYAQPTAQDAYLLLLNRDGGTDR